MNSRLAQPVIEDSDGRLYIVNDWFERPLPKNIVLEEMSYPDTSYSFSTFFSEEPVGFRLGYASGNYGHGLFTTGQKGSIEIGQFVVLQGIRMICNLSITIHDHCMFSWGSVITDSWITDKNLSPAVRRHMLEAASNTQNRHSKYLDPRPVIIEENVWVGFDAVILPGVTIGRGAVIGCKTIISEDVAPYSVVVGNPPRVIKYLKPNDTPEIRKAALLQFSAKVPNS